MSAQPATLRRPEDLVAAGLIDHSDVDGIAAVAQRFTIAITSDIAALIDRDDPDDPIARQFVPSLRELDIRDDELADPIGDEAHSPVRGVVHRYPDRALLKIVGVCPIYCRFCFRREMVGPQNAANLTPREVDDALAYLAARPEVWEVIVTGGDPFVLSPARVAALTSALSAIPHVKVLRWHTRVPIVAPASITDAFIAALAGFSGTTVVGIHANHPRELTPAACNALRRLADSGAMLVSQTVLLKGINDDPDTLAGLMRGFVANRVKPYYLHHADLAPGTAHFRTTVAEGQALMRALRGRVSGLCQPTYVVDLPGGFGKSPIGPHYLREDGRIDDFRGEAHEYPTDGPV